MGYYVDLQLTQSSNITTPWTLAGDTGGQMVLSIYAGTPFDGQPNPTGFLPTASPLATVTGRPSVTTGLSAAPAGTYSVFFYKQGVGLDQPSTGTISYQSGTCS